MMYQGKQLDVFYGRRPLNITSNELKFFSGRMPAKLKKLIITQPGQSFQLLPVVRS
jgi:hypothetical protein